MNCGRLPTTDRTRIASQPKDEIARGLPLLPDPRRSQPRRRRVPSAASRLTRLPRPGRVHLLDVARAARLVRSRQRNARPRGRVRAERAARRAARPHRRARSARCAVQRATGGGALDCPELQREMGFSDLPPPTAAAVRACAAKIAPNRQFFGTDDVVRDLDALRRALGAGRWVLDGTSYGTYTAERYALAYPGHVSKLV